MPTIGGRQMGDDGKEGASAGRGQGVGRSLLRADALRPDRPIPRPSSRLEVANPESTIFFGISAGRRRGLWQPEQCSWMVAPLKEVEPDEAVPAFRV